MLRRRARRQRRHRAGKVRLLRRPQLSGPAPSVVLGMTLSGTPMSDPATDGAPCAATIHARTVDALYRSHHRSLVGYLRARLPSHEDAEELAQEAFARVLALDDMSCIENLEGYLFRVATNLVMERAPRPHVRDQIGRAPCRARGCAHGSIP